jgi:hypothetical protein
VISDLHDFGDFELAAMFATKLKSAKQTSFLQKQETYRRRRK